MPIRSVDNCSTFSNKRLFQYLLRIREQILNVDSYACN